MNTINTSTYSQVWRNKYRSAVMQRVLRTAVVAEAICEVDRSGSYYIQNPHGSQPTAVVQVQDGSYSVSAWTTTEDTLTVDNEVIYAEHIFDFERILAHYNLFANRTEEQANAVARGIDDYVLNNLAEDGTTAYTTPAGGFTTAANVNVIISNIISLVSGYQNVENGFFLVLENTDLTGVIQAQFSNGFSFADAALKNGFIGSYGGVDIYVVRTGIFRDATLAGETVTNNNHRVAGVKRVATYATPGGVRFEEKGVTAKTGIEFVTHASLGFRLWTQNATLIVDITLA